MAFHTTIQGLNLPDVALAAEQVGAFRDKRQANQQARSDQRGFRAQVPGILAGDPGAIEAGAGFDPQTTALLLDAAAKMDDRQLKASQNSAVEIARLALPVLNAAPQDRPDAYQAALAQAGSSGLDVSNLPPQYTPEIEPQLNAMIAQALEVGEFFKMVQQSRAPLSAPGKVQRDIDRGLVPAGTPLRTPAADGKGGKTAFNQADKLRKAFDSASKDFVKIRDAFGRIVASAKDPSAAGDLALIFNYMKVLDPGSVVRESEFATAANAAGVPDRIRNIWNRVLSGERLGVEQRADFVSRAESLFDSQLRFQEANVERFTGLASAFDIDPANVVSDLTQGLQRPLAPDAPAVPAVAAPVTPAAAPAALAPAASPVAAPTPLPPGVPPGSTQIGTRNGNPVYEAPDGRRFEVSP